MLHILPLPLPPPPYEQDDDAGDQPTKQENHPHSNQKYLRKKKIDFFSKEIQEIQALQEIHKGEFNPIRTLKRERSTGKIR